MDYSKDFLERNMKEPKNWKKPLDSDIFNSIFRIIGIIFNFVFSKLLMIVTLFIVVLLIKREWSPAIVLTSFVFPIYLIKFVIRWMIKNHRNIKTSETSENVTFVKFEKDENI